MCIVCVLCVIVCDCAIIFDYLVVLMIIATHYNTDFCSMLILFSLFPSLNILNGAPHLLRHSDIIGSIHVLRFESLFVCLL